MSQLALVYGSPIPNASHSIESWPIPEPLAGQVQVKLHAAAVNPVDYKIYDYGLFLTKFPTILGTDGAGEVTKVGPAVTRFKVGDRITFQGKYGDSDKASFQQYATLDANLAAKIPDNIDYDAASGIPVASIAAVASLYDLGLGLTAPWKNAEGLYKGQTLVVLGGSSSVGSYAIQLAVLSGFKVITTSSLKHSTYLYSLGASTVIDRSSSNVASEIIAAAGGQVAYVVDAISLPDTQAQALEILSNKGKLSLVLAANTKTLTDAEAKDIKVVTVRGVSYADPDFYGGYWAALGGYLERGVLKPNRTHVLSGGLRAWEEAFTLHRTGKESICTSIVDVKSSTQKTRKSRPAIFLELCMTPVLFTNFPSYRR